MERNRYQEPKSSPKDENSQLKQIHIGPLDPSITKESLQSYFKKLNLSLILFNLKQSIRLSKNFVKGHTTDPHTFEYLTVTKTSHKIKKCVFGTQEFVKGKKKLESEFKKSKKQVYVGYIPEKMGEKKLASFFGTFGAVKSAFVNPIDKTGNKYGFVTFENEEVAKRVIEMEEIYFEKHRMVVKEFTPKWATDTNKAEKKEDDFEYIKKSEPIKEENSKFIEKNGDNLLVILRNDFGNIEKNIEKPSKLSLKQLRMMKGKERGKDIKPFTPFEFSRNSSSYNQRELLDFIKNKHRNQGIDLRLNW